MLEVFALRDRERKAVVTGTTAVLFSYHSYPYLFENPIKTYESKLLAIYFFNFCTVCIFYVTVQMICLICFCPILKKPFSFFLFCPAPSFVALRQAFSLCCSAFVTVVSTKLWLWHCYKGQSYKEQT